MSNPNELDIRFSYWPPKPGQADKYADLRAKGKALAEAIENTVPECREKSLAITKIEEAVMWANAGIARRG